MLLRSLFILVLLAGAGHSADVAMVEDDLGQALLFENRGLCYAVLPNHVSATKDRVALFAPSPQTVGTAEIFWRDTDNDVALAYVEGALSDRCSITFDALPTDLSGVHVTTETGLIKSVHFDGAFFDRIGATLIDVDDTFVTVRLSDAGTDADVIQGLSGAVLSVAGTLSGIAIDAGDTGEARFLRIDRIRALIGRQLSATLHPSTQAIGAASSGYGYRVTEFDAGEGSGVIGLEPGDQGSTWISEWSGAPVNFEITLSNTEILPLNKISIFSFVSSTTTPPRRIKILIDRGLPASPYWTPIATPDMSPTGVFEAATGGTWARRIKIQIVDVWYPERSLRIDQLVVE
ncbi:hypothetical protein ABMC89_14370 [Sulfitobacter sp. HNIBRBA3233]|uniref:hypothetical protein n=1 Tax=Sulfitobacter marinivivus TaxID=3158558 RepID=UPI0032E04EC1